MVNALHEETVESQSPAPRPAAAVPGTWSHSAAFAPRQHYTGPTLSGDHEDDHHCLSHSLHIAASALLAITTNLQLLAQTHHRVRELQDPASDRCMPY